jgi:hypothetical protein
VDATRKFIKELRKEVDRRNEALNSPEARSTFTRPDGIKIRRQPTKIHELTEEQRTLLQLNFRVIIIDEMATVMATKPGDRSTVVEDIRHIVATMRSAGLIFGFGIHRPDANILTGFTRDLIRVRIFQGMPLKQTMRMVFEDLYDRTWDLRDDFSAGTVLALGLGNPPSAQVTEGRELHLHPDFLHPMLGEDGSEIPVSIPNGRDTPVGGGFPRVDGGRSERSWEDRARWWLRTGWATVRLTLAWRVPVPERDVEFRGTLLKTKALACVACGASGYLEADHIRPLWAGGADDPQGNGQLLCKPHHARKSRWEAQAMALGAPLPAMARWAGAALLIVAWVRW